MEEFDFHKEFKKRMRKQAKWDLIGVSIFVVVFIIFIALFVF